MDDEYRAGASASLNKTISAIMLFLEKSEKRPQDIPLRDFLHEKLADYGSQWYRHGIRREHMECQKQSKDGSVPRTILFNATKEFFTEIERDINIRSRIKRKRK